ncbi:hypothetical protein AAVH_34974, partial [Aphelenchoides avenae]
GAMVLGAGCLRHVHPYAIHLDTPVGEPRHQLQQHCQRGSKRHNGQRRCHGSRRVSTARPTPRYCGQLPMCRFVTCGRCFSDIRTLSRLCSDIPARRRATANDRLRLPKLGHRHRARVVGRQGM